MLNQFSRTEFLFGKEAMEKLRNSRGSIFGIGGEADMQLKPLHEAVGELDL